MFGSPTYGRYPIRRIRRYENEAILYAMAIGPLQQQPPGLRYRFATRTASDAHGIVCMPEQHADGQLASIATVQSRLKQQRGFASRQRDKKQRIRKTPMNRTRRLMNVSRHVLQFRIATSGQQGEDRLLIGQPRSCRASFRPSSTGSMSPADDPNIGHRNAQRFVESRLKREQGEDSGDSRADLVNSLSCHAQIDRT